MEKVHHVMYLTQVCVPKNWTDEQVKDSAGTTNGWFIRKNGDQLLNGDPERRVCDDRKGFVHIMLDA